MKTNRAISVLVVACMLMTVFSITASASVFSDVSERDWFYDGVMYCWETDLMLGTSGGLFEPQNTLTRAMAATVIYRMLGSHKASHMHNSFKDVPEGEWYTDAIKWMAFNTLIAGYDRYAFGPNDPVTKEQMALMIFRAGYSTGKLPAPTGTGSAFDDIDSCNDWAYQAVDELNRLGVFSDLQGGSFNPQNSATRAEAASMLYRYREMMDAANGPGSYEGYYGEDFMDELYEYWFEPEATYILYNNEHVYFYIAAGGKLLYVGTSAQINGEECWEVIVSRNETSGLNFTHTYAVGLDSKRVYRFHDEFEEWYAVETWDEFGEG